MKCEQQICFIETLECIHSHEIDSCMRRVSGAPGLPPPPPHRKIQNY